MSKTETKRWSVSAVVTGSKFLGVFEAGTKKEAISAALHSDSAHVSLCRQCTDQCEDPEIVSADAWPVEENPSDE